MIEKRAAPSRGLLARLLEQPQLVKKVQALPAPALLALIDHVGLADAGELVAMATVEQLERMFDEDLWRSSAPGADERFEPARFGLWLEVLLEAGGAFAADRLAELDEELLAPALHEQVLVVDLDELVLTAIEPELEQALEREPYLEFDQYRVLARRLDGWDALSAALTELDERHGGLLRRLLERLCRASSEWIADNGGLCQVLTAVERLEEDAAAAREERRARAGHVSPASARAFLKLPAASVQRILDEPRDAITRAYFREYRAPETPAPDRGATWIEELADEPADRSDHSGGPRPLLAGETAAAAGTLLRRALASLDEETAAERLRELAYLSNVLLAGSTRRLRPLEAADEVLATCDAGLARAIEATGRTAEELLARTGCEKLFRLGRDGAD